MKQKKTSYKPFLAFILAAFLGISMASTMAVAMDDSSSGSGCDMSLCYCNMMDGHSCMCRSSGDSHGGECTMSCGCLACAKKMTEKLIENVTVAGLNEFSDIPLASDKKLLANLKLVETFIETGQIQPAINQLYAFIGKLNSILKATETAGVFIVENEEKVNMLAGKAEKIIAKLSER